MPNAAPAALADGAFERMGEPLGTRGAGGFEKGREKGIKEGSSLRP
jgi:hypothetical protein